MPNTPERPRRIRVQRDGPLLIEGPVEVVGENGEVTVSDRFTVAVCTCRRSRLFPWCDTSHRHRTPPRAPETASEATTAQEEASTAREGGTA
ncbi:MULTISPECIES: CDGSH iron-sulfur domain-containing protein [unclassified Streptomyces]|uniref:CDGSH iron-sulfur domain-containing protein n=1 Tax=unclassified Streptomyces TaxID=2593676 RepID=UPI0022594E01|nr:MULTISPECIES: CDGSH iron-sulfur domain-containing protein [unclassified Streptomyces]MCX5060563.1 CDGSH iron-sulfur domain-containing protein [Streptomyces sp. NBC_00452]MCX5293845.1 CDGSH iron-sulfur domain-containing protein [Streptomyces sp. NBC_00183]